jgi:hypothetical protein
MTIRPPSKLCFLISLIIVILALLGTYAGVAALAGYTTWLFIAAWVVLVAGNVMKGF